MVPFGKRDTSVPRSSTTAEVLRRRAENLIQANLPVLHHHPHAMTLENMRTMLHELQVHQIELEMQNEELRRIQLQLDAARARYFDLYDLAPVAYCTVNENGFLQEANMAAAKLLGVTRSVLMGRPMNRFIARGYQDTYYLCRQHMVDSGMTQTCELKILKSDATTCWVELTTSVVFDDHGTAVQHLILHDVDDAKVMADAMRESEARFHALVEKMGQPI